MTKLNRQVARRVTADSTTRQPEALEQVLLKRATPRVDRLAVGDAIVLNHARRPVNPRVSVVIPALNEAENLPFVLPRIPPGVHEVVLVVDGYSTDDTVAVAYALMPEIRIVAQDGHGK